MLSLADLVGEGRSKSDQFKKNSTTGQKEGVWPREATADSSVVYAFTLPTERQTNESTFHQGSKVVKITIVQVPQVLIFPAYPLPNSRVEFVPQNGEKVTQLFPPFEASKWNRMESKHT